MAPAFVQSPTPFENDAGGTTIPLAFGSNVQAGSVLVCHFSFDNAQGSVNSVGDSLNGGWTNIINTNNTPNAQRSEVYYFLNSAAGACTVTANLSGTIDFRRMAIIEVSGLQNAAPDKSASAIGASTAPNSGSVTTTADGEYILGCFQFNGTTISNLNGFTSRAEGTNKECAMLDKIQTTQGAIAASVTLAGSTNWLAAIITFKATGGATADVAAQCIQLAFSKPTMFRAGRA